MRRPLPLTAALVAAACGLCAVPVAPSEAAARAPAPVEVVVEGVDGDLHQNVLASLGIARLAEALEDEREGEPPPVDPGPLTEARIRDLHRKAPDEIRRALRPFGYYRPRVGATLTREASGWIARYRVDPGEPVLLERVDIRLRGPGEEDTVLRDGADDFPLAPGEPARHDRYEDGKGDLHLVALERGYLDAAYARSVLAVDTAARRARVELVLETGPRFRFGAVRFEEADRDADEDPSFRDAFLRRFVPFREGELYSGEQLLALQTALVDSDYFDRVEVAAPREEAEGSRVPVRVVYDPRSHVRYGGGLGYGTDTQVRGSAQASWSRLNAAGHRLSLEGSASFVSGTFTATYVVPVGRRFGARVTGAGGYRSEFFEDLHSRVARASLSWDRAWLGLRHRLALSGQEEWFATVDDEGRSTLVLASASLSHTQANDPVFVRRGRRFLAEVEGAHRALLSDASFLQARLEGKLVRSPWDRGRILARLELGATVTDSFARLPTSVRFFAGGDRSVRGFGYQTLGARDPEGRPVGGRYLATGSLELEHRFLEAWGAAVFLDVGNVSEELSGASLERAVGVGARWLSPVGLLRLDVAAAVSREGTPLRLHITLGPDF